MNNHTSSVGKRMILRRVIIYGAAVFLIGVLQCSFFSRLKPFGATPDLLLGVIAAIALLDNRESATVAAVAGGFFIDALGAIPPSFSSIFYLVCAVIAIAIS